MKRINSDNLSQKAADSIAERIIRRDLLPGKRLVEAKLARELGVSQGTIREALRILEKKKMVTIQPRRGTTVTMLSAEYIESLFDFLGEIYVLLISKAMQKMTPEASKELSRSIEAIRKSLQYDDGLSYGDAIFDTLSVFMRVANDPFVEHAITDLWQVTRWVQFETILHKNEKNIDNYMELNTLELAISGSSIEEVSVKIREYVQYAKQIVLDAYSNATRADAAAAAVGG